MAPQREIRRPQLVRHARYRWDEVRLQHQVVFPEGILVLNDSGAAIVRLCDGRPLHELLATLARQFAESDSPTPAAPRKPPDPLSPRCSEGEANREEVLEFLQRLAQKGLLRDADP